MPFSKKVKMAESGHFYRLLSRSCHPDTTAMAGKRLFSFNLKISKKVSAS